MILSRYIAGSNTTYCRTPCRPQLTTYKTSFMQLSWAYKAEMSSSQLLLILLPTHLLKINSPLSNNSEPLQHFVTCPMMPPHPLYGIPPLPVDASSTARSAVSHHSFQAIPVQFYCLYVSTQRIGGLNLCHLRTIHGIRPLFNPIMIFLIRMVTF